MLLRGSAGVALSQSSPSAVPGAKTRAVCPGGWRLSQRAGGRGAPVPPSGSIGTRQPDSFTAWGGKGTGGQGEGCWNWAPEDWPRELRAESSLPPSPGAWHPWKMGGMLLCCSPRAPSILLARSRCWRQPQGPVARRPRTTRLGWRAKRGRRGK